MPAVRAGQRPAHLRHPLRPGGDPRERPDEIDPSQTAGSQGRVGGSLGLGVGLPLLLFFLTLLLGLGLSLCAALVLFLLAALAGTLPTSAVVTGGGSGLGRATATALAAGGAHVVIADLPTSPGLQVADSLGPPARFVATDVTDAGQVAAAVAAAGGRVAARPASS